MGVEVALALAVLLAAALFWRSFSETRDADPGFKREGVLLANYDFTERNADAPVAREFARATARTASRRCPASRPRRSRPPCRSTFTDSRSRSFTLEGRASSAAAPDRALTNTVTPGYLRTMGIPLVAGSDFADLRDAAAPPQAIVNEEFVRRFLDAAEPLGRRAREPRHELRDRRRRAQLGQRIVRRGADPGDLSARTAIVRRRAARSISERVPAPNRCWRRSWSASCGSSIPPFRSTTSGR